MIQKITGQCKDNLGKRIWFGALSLILLLLAVLIGPADFFRYGYYSNEVNYSDISAEDVLETIDLSQNELEASFSPQEDYFSGFEIYPVEVEENTSGLLLLTTYTVAGEEIEKQEIDIGKISPYMWNTIFTREHYDKNVEYRLNIKAVNCNGTIVLPLVDQSYLPEESLGNELLLGYVYAQPTFTYAEKVLICMVLFTVWVMLLGECVFQGRKCVRRVAFILGMTTLLSWSYMFGSFDEENTRFESFEKGSDALVLGVIEGEKEGMGQKYGLARIFIASGYYNSVSNEFLSDENWFHGYGRIQPQILINANPYTQSIANIGTLIQFENGDYFSVINVKEDGETYEITLDADGPLNYYKYGDLNNARFYIDGDGAYNQQPKGFLVSYVKQYGLQGKIFRHLVHYMSADSYAVNLELICCILTGFVLTTITIFLKIKYDSLFAVCFAITALLSPCLVNFASSEYWVTFTWFIPMLIGLVCSIWINQPWVRRGCYIAAFIAITGRALCGYEYMTAIMLGLVSFMLIDLCVAVANRDKSGSILLFRTVFIIGCFALAGFMAAFCIHASLRGDGNVLDGILTIIREDAVPRIGGDTSAWEVVKKYFHFETDIIAGMDANMFPILCLLPIFIFLYNYVKKQLNLKNVFMYFIFFVIAVSWFILAKGHSNGHTGLNYVLWYFGFVQCCFYIIINAIISYAGQKENKKVGA